MTIVCFALAGCFARGQGSAVFAVPVFAPAGAEVVSSAPPVTAGDANANANASAGAGASAPGAPATALSCEEPDLGWGGCKYECAVDARAGTSSCNGRIAFVEGGPESGALRADVSGARGMLVRVETCDPRGWVLHVADSPTSNGWGGDSGTFSNDAELHLSDSDVHVYSSDDRAPGTDPHAGVARGFSSASGCSTRSIWIGNGAIVGDGGLAMCAPWLLRINPATDREGAPDSLWWIGLNRTVADSSRAGSGLVRASFCIRE